MNKSKAILKQLINYKNKSKTFWMKKKDQYYILLMKAVLYEKNQQQEKLL